VEKQKVTLTVEKGCINCLNYFAIFKFPLTAEEIHLFNSARATHEEMKFCLRKLTNEQHIFKIDGFYLPENKPEWVAERNMGNQRALELLNRSGKFAKIIAGFPFIRGVAISGSLSKFYASKEADIDYFIITKSNRLWIARSLLHLFKKLTFITGHQHYFCMNYFVDTNALEITHQNLYSAIETVTLLPVYNAVLVESFMEKNTWVKKYLPNHNSPPNENFLVKTKNYRLKQLTEWFLNHMAPSKLNRFLMNLTDKKWRAKWKSHGYSEKEYKEAFQTEIAISKNHPVDYQKKVLNTLADKQPGVN